MPGQLSFLPRSLRRLYFLAQLLNTLLKRQQLTPNLFILTGRGLKRGHLAFDLLDFLLRLVVYFHG
jgi:hypothetical protein